MIKTSFVTLIIIKPLFEENKFQTPRKTSFCKNITMKALFEQNTKQQYFIMAFKMTI